MFCNNLISNEFFKISINPLKGTSIVNFHVNKNGKWLEVMPDTSKPNSELDAASFLMIPYSNRIENGLFEFEGKKYNLQTKHDTHAIHGDVRYRPWELKSRSDNRIIYSFTSESIADINWPWKFEGEAVYSLEKNIFHSEIKVKNKDISKMPVGLGWHPYFNRDLTTLNEKVFLCFDNERVYPDDFDNRIPSGLPQPIPENRSFSKEKFLERDDFFDKCFQGFKGKGFIHWPESKLKLLFECSGLCSHLIIYNPLKPYFAVEPVTNANNGVNLLSKGHTCSGVKILYPGEALSAFFNLIVD
ncbi:MAG: aldose 1-epimerase [uncultured bacterium]|nr:MAG: aldose 1-epimerase [uncultured bacterium]